MSCINILTVPHSPAKPSRPSRAYLHLTNETHLLPFSDVVRQSNFEDSMNTFTNSCLVGPPVVEFAPYNRIPAGRPRVDARAGTIDQDAEFMAFLEGLANPVTTKDVSADSIGEGSVGKPEKVTTTPLVQFLKEKKASKTKEAALKAAKKQEAKSKSSVSGPDDVKKKTKDAKPERALERAAKEAVKILNREASKPSASTNQTSTGSSATAAESSSNTPKLDISKVPPRQRSAATAAHIRMLQRDLGFSPAQAHRQVKRDAADAQKAERAAAVEKAAPATKDSPSTQTTQASSSQNAPKSNSNQSGNRKSRGKGPNDSASTKSSASSSKASASQGPNTATLGPSTPVILLRKPEANSSNATSTPSSTPSVKPPPTVLARKPQAVPTPSEGATQAFVKHANASQGVTEPLLKEAMEKFGPISHLEIDRRKGFAYVDFVDTDGLKKAMAANPIAVGQGTVQVLQRKGTALAPEKKPPSHTQNATPRGGRGGGGRGGTVGRRGGRGGGRGGAQGSSESSKASTSTTTGTPAKG